MVTALLPRACPQRLRVTYRASLEAPGVGRTPVTLGALDIGQTGAEAGAVVTPGRAAPVARAG